LVGFQILGASFVAIVVCKGYPPFWYRETRPLIYYLLSRIRICWGIFLFLRSFFKMGKF